MIGSAGSVAELLVSPTEISATGMKISAYEHTSSVFIEKLRFPNKRTKMALLLCPVCIFTSEVYELATINKVTWVDKTTIEWTERYNVAPVWFCFPTFISVDWAKISHVNEGRFQAHVSPY